MFTYSYRVSFHISSKYCTVCRATRSEYEYNAHAFNLAKLQPPTSINVHWKVMQKTIQIIRKNVQHVLHCYLHLL